MGPEDAQVVVDLGHRADGRAGVAGVDLLLDGDGGGEPLDHFDMRARHLLDKLAGVGGERLGIAALPLGVDRLKGKRAFARAGGAGRRR